MGCAVGTVKFAVFVFNFVLVCLGFAMILFGTMDSPMPEEFEKITDYAGSLSLTSRMLIIVGGIIFVVAFFGCWGAVSDSSCMLFLYAMFLIGLILAEIAFGIYVFLNKDKAIDQAGKELNNFQREYDHVQNAKKIIDAIQSKVECCGVRGQSDWQTRSEGLPASCCKNGTTYCQADSAYQEGCLNKIVRLVKDKTGKLQYIGIGIIVAEILTVLFALIVRNSIRNSERRSYA